MTVTRIPTSYDAVLCSCYHSRNFRWFCSLKQLFAVQVELHLPLQRHIYSCGLLRRCLLIKILYALSIRIASIVGSILFLRHLSVQHELLYQYQLHLRYCLHICHKYAAVNMGSKWLTSTPKDVPYRLFTVLYQPVICVYHGSSQCSAVQQTIW